MPTRARPSPRAARHSRCWTTQAGKHAPDDGQIQATKESSSQPRAAVKLRQEASRRATHAATSSRRRQGNRQGPPPQIQSSSARRAPAGVPRPFGNEARCHRGRSRRQWRKGVATEACRRWKEGDRPRVTQWRRHGGHGSFSYCLCS